MKAKFKIEYLNLYLVFFLGICIRFLYFFYSENNNLNIDSTGFHTQSLRYIEKILPYYYAIENNLHYFSRDSMEMFDLHTSTYPYFISFVYRLFFPSIFLGSFVSIFFWICSFLLLFHILRLLNLNYKLILLILFLFSILPNSVLHTSTYLRESFQGLMNLITVYALLKIIIFRRNIYVFIFLISNFLLIFTHEIYVILLLLNFSLLFLYYFTELFKKNILFPFFGFFLILIVLIFYHYNEFIVSFFIEYHNKLFNRNLNSFFYDARTNYRDFDILNHFNSILFYYIKIFYDYMFMPLIWTHNLNKFDLVVFADNLFRNSILFIIIFNILFKNINYKMCIVLLLLFFFNEIIWSVGTVNWGTALRHHYPAFPILLVLLIISFNTIDTKYNK